MTVKLLTEQHLEFLLLQRGCTGSSESILVKMPHCWKSHVPAQMYVQTILLAEKKGFQSTEQQNHIQTFSPKKSRHKEIWLL